MPEMMENSITSSDCVGKYYDTGHELAQGSCTIAHKEYI